MATRLCQRTVSGDEWGIQRFSQRYINGVISRQTVPHLPDAGKQREMRIAGEWKIAQVREGFSASFSGDDGRTHVAAQDLRDFQVDQMRSM
jgi:hypothetical protein